MPLAPPTFNELYADFRARMERVGFTHWAEGSRIGMIGKTFCAYLGDLWNQLAQIELQSNPSTARGVYLDRLGQMFGLSRKGPQVAGTLGRGPGVQFTNNGGTSVTIPAGTRVWNPEDPDVAFFTVNALTLAAGAQGFTDVVAASAGELYNVGTNRLTYHNAGMGQTSVTNVRPIGGGTLGETDASYRFRIQQHLQARHSNSELAIQQAVLKIPGVRDALVQSGVRGDGTLDVLVVPIDRYMSNELLTAAELAVAGSVAGGVSWRVKAPRARRVNVRVQLRLQPGVTLAEVQAQVDSAVRGYVDNLRVHDGKGGSDLIYNELVSRIMDSSPDILDAVITLSLEGAQVLQSNILTQPGDRLISGSTSIS